MKATSTLGQVLDLPERALDALKLRLDGRLSLPGDAAHAAASRIWNARIRRTPAAIAHCRGSADIVACVAFAREHDWLLSVKGGGHNIAGLALADGALMLDLSPMRGIWVDAPRRRARVQAGCLLADVDRETQLHGLATVLGFVSQTGIAGLTLGGGFGYLTRRWGWTTDNVIAMDMIGADARLIRASEDENPDLFWGLRGGGGNFGVVTEFEFKLHGVGPEILGGLVAWPASEASAVLKLYTELAETAPPELTLAAMLRLAPPAPWLPKEAHGKPIVALLACYSGVPEAGAKLIATIKGYGRPLGDTLTRRPYAQLQSMLDATQPSGRRYYWKSEFLPGVAPPLCEAMIEHAAQLRSPHSALVLFQIAGALNRIEADASAMGNRDARYVLNITGAWEDAAADAEEIEWVRRAWSQLRQYSTAGNYVNFQTEDEGAERLASALGPAIPRLKEIKRRWDPHNAFRVNRNFAPA